MSFETPAIITSVVMMGMSLLGFVLNRRSGRQAKGRTLTITIEDSSGARARTVTHSDRSVEEVKRLLDRLVAQPS